MIQDSWMLNQKGYLHVTTEKLAHLIKKSISDKTPTSVTNWYDLALLAKRVFDRFIYRHRRPTKHSRMRLEVLLRYAVMTEIAMHILSMDKRYRDHFAHQFNVGALGWLLLAFRLPGTRQRLLEYIMKSKGWSEKDTYACWWLASLFHDHGYLIPRLFTLSGTLGSIREKTALVPTEVRRRFGDPEEMGLGGMFGLAERMRSVATDVLNDCSFMLCPSLLELSVDFCAAGSERAAITEQMRILVATTLRRLRFDDSMISLLCTEPWDHGVLGATNLLEHMKVRGKFWERELQTGVLVESLRAVAMHNNPRVTRIDIQEDPITYLLVLCDELQEWERLHILPDEDVIELGSIKIGPLERAKDGTLVLRHTLNVKFPYKDVLGLKAKTGWQRDIFLALKRKNLGKLRGPMDIKVVA